VSDLGRYCWKTQEFCKVRFSLDLNFSKESTEYLSRAWWDGLCREFRYFIYPLVSKWTKLVTEAEIFSRSPKKEFFNRIGHKQPLASWNWASALAKINRPFGGNVSTRFGGFENFCLHIVRVSKLVHQGTVNGNKQQHEHTNMSALQAASIRLRPILMASFSTIIGRNSCPASVSTIAWFMHLKILPSRKSSSWRICWLIAPGVTFRSSAASVKL